MDEYVCTRHKEWATDDTERLAFAGAGRVGVAALELELFCEDPVLGRGGGDREVEGETLVCERRGLVGETAGDGR